MKETERVKVDGGDVLFEYGPRSFRVVQVKGYSTSNLVRLSLLFIFIFFVMGSFVRRAYMRYIIELMVGSWELFWSEI